MIKKHWIKGAAALFCAAFLCAAGGATAFADNAGTGETAASAEAESETAAEDTGAVNTTASITSCLITGNGSTIQVEAESNGDMENTDGYLYLFELKPYEDVIGGRTDYAAWADGGTAASFTLDLNRGTAEDRLYSRFVVAVKTDEGDEEVSDYHYITNPETVAANRDPYREPLSKKGLQMEVSQLGDAFQLGVKHSSVNIAFHQILGEGIDYEYDGKTYHFSKAVIETYDETISAMSNKDITVTAIILNGWNDATPNLLVPGTTKKSNVFYYMPNVQTQEGFEQTRAIAAFLAERYNGDNPNYGKVSNWIIGNEINNQQWNHMGATDIINYVQTYQEAFRVFYTAIKSTSANDRVFFSLDYNWNNEADGKLKYGGKEIIDYFNSIANVQGQMDWGVAYHPYPCPMTDAIFWDDASTGLITNDVNSPVVNFINLNVLTDYLATTAFQKSNGEVRNIMLTEEGFTATNANGDDLSQIQAAAYAYSYYLVDSNPYIDAYILSRQVDAPSEVSQGLAFGLWTCDMSQPDQIIPQQRRKIWEVFRDIDNSKRTLETTEFAKSIIGIEKWSDVVPNFKWRNQEQ